MLLPGAAPELSDYVHAALILLAFALLASENLVHYPVALMALAGLWQVARRPRLVRAPAVLTVLALFALVWLPMVVATIDAVAFEHSHETTLLYLHFLPAAVYLAVVGMRPGVQRLVMQGVVLLVLFVGFDAFAQLIWRVDLFGYPYDGHVLKGVFHPKQRLGLFLAVFAPLAIAVTGAWARTFPQLWLLHVPQVVVIALSLKRSAWLMLVVAIGGYLALRASGAQRAIKGWQALALVALLAAAVALNPALRGQLERSAGLVSGDAAEFDRASSYRLTLWRSGWRMFGANWLDGVGPRGYRHAYAEHAPADDFWLQRGGQTHPHLLLLEVAAETGAIGLAGLAVFYAVVLRRMLRARGSPAALWLLCALVAWLPFNAHLAFYGSYWSTLAWLLLGLGCGAAFSLPARPVAVVRGVP